VYKKSIMRKRFITLAYLFLLTSSIIKANGPVKVLFRYDDFLLAPSALSDSLLSIFRKNGIPLCISIIPYNNEGNLINKIDSDKISDLISRINNKEIEVALHGYNHVNHIKHAFFCKSTYSEFATIGYEQQYIQISAGKRVIDSLLKRDIKIFVPPFNTYDMNTLRALENLKFEIISGSRQGTSRGGPLKYMPATLEDFSDLPSVIEKNKDKDVTIIIYFHPYSFKGSASKYSKDLTKLISTVQLDEMLQWLKKKNVSFTAFSDLTEKYDFSSSEFQANAFKYNLLKKALNYLKIYDYGIFTHRFSNAVNVLLIIGNLLLHIISFLLVFAIMNYFLKIFNPRMSIIVTLLLICMVPVLFFLLYIRNDYSFCMILALLLVNLIAVFLSVWNRYKTKPILYAGGKN
jgi:hypothetical protein